MDDMLSSLLRTQDVLLADGGMGTSLFERGLANGAPGELWNLDRPDQVEVIHQGFVDAGSDIILTNSFGANSCRLKFHDAAHAVREINQAAASIGRRVSDRAGRPIIVAGSMGPTGEVLEPIGTFCRKAAQESFADQARALKEGGVDLAWIETMFSEEELTAAVAAVESVGLAYVLTMTFDSSGRTMMGIGPDQAVALTRKNGWRPSALGANCGTGPAQLLDSIIGLGRAAEADDIIVAKGNCGTPTMGADMLPHYDGTPEIMANYACLARDAGARVIGGCCGTTPVHIAHMRRALAEHARGDVPGYDKIERLLGAVRNTAGDPRAGRLKRERRRRSAE